MRATIKDKGVVKTNADSETISHYGRCMGERKHVEHGSIVEGMARAACMRMQVNVSHRTQRVGTDMDTGANDLGEDQRAPA
ncbi:hypothetical protein FNV43_RR08862 [Rhamnella rubrinervis]|uniref:Uncharacterized protein n=1 Tax=Rhamnella rubrinervis TaxID=2594499 RepID=A0A8K0H9C8_9ROSA|nr:hypothetical protein FNV43_RR08862 [Rhamnella rubrinervis]